MRPPDRASPIASRPSAELHRRWVCCASVPRTQRIGRSLRPWISLTLSGANTFTNGFNLSAGTLIFGVATTGTVTNGYGLYITGEGTGGTWTNKAYDVYAADTNVYNYFGGKVGSAAAT